MAKKFNPKSELFSSILYIVVGVLLAVFPGEALSWAMTIAGIVFVVSGILEILKKNFGGGVVSIVIGVAILTLGWLVTGIVLIVLGVLIAIKGVVALLEVLKSSKKGLIDFLYPVLTIVIGLKNMTTRDNTFVIPTVILGVVFVVCFIAFMVLTNKWINALRMRRANEKLSSTQDGTRLLELRSRKELYENLLDIE